jgi:putative ABC transport system ATP-binding protein
VIKIENLSLSFHDQKIFENFSLHINRGDKIAVRGESGRGKSSLLKLILGFIPVYNGRIIIDDILLQDSTVKQIRKKTSWLPQDTSIQSSTVNELLFTPFEFAENKKSIPSEDEINSLLQEFHLKLNIRKKKVKEISGGQKQRILLISSLLLKKPILLLDEPSSALDDTVKKIVCDYIFMQNDLTVAASTHDEYWIEKSDKVIEL